MATVLRVRRGVTVLETVQPHYVQRVLIALLQVEVAVLPVRRGIIALKEPLPQPRVRRERIVLPPVELKRVAVPHVRRGVIARKDPVPRLRALRGRIVLLQVERVQVVVRLVRQGNIVLKDPLLRLRALRGRIVLLQVERVRVVVPVVDRIKLLQQVLPVLLNVLV